MKCVIASATKAPEPHEGSRTCCSRGRVNEFADNRARKPARGVVLAQLPAFAGGDDRLVQDGSNVRRRLQSVEAGDARRDVSDDSLAVHFGRPREEVGLDDALQSDVVAEALTSQQVRRVGLRQLADVYAEGGLDDEADGDAEVCVADEQAVHLILGAGELAEGGLEEGLPEILFDADGLSEVGEIGALRASEREALRFLAPTQGFQGQSGS